MQSVRAWVTPVFSPAQLSTALRKLRVAHSVQVAASGPSRWHTVGKGEVKAHITSKILDVREGVCNFIVCCYAEAHRVQAPRLPEAGDICDAVSYALECDLDYPGFKVKPELTMLEYVDAIADPSMINEIQTGLLRVNPYDLRKAADTLITRVLAGQVSLKEARARLRHNLRTEPLAALLEKARPLRQAVVASYKIGAEAAAELHAVPLFEINYVRKKCDSKTSKGGTTSS